MNGIKQGYTSIRDTLSHQLSQPLSQSPLGKWREDGRDERSTHIGG